MGNVWIEPLPERQIVYFISDYDYFVVPVSNMVKLYDFDMSYFKGCPTNLKLDNDYYCENYGMCNDDNNKFDVFIFLCGLYKDFTMQQNTAVKSFVMRFIESVISEKLLNIKLPFECRLCNLHTEHECNGPYTPSDEEMKPIVKIMENPIFKKYLNKIGENVDPEFFYFSPSVNKNIAYENFLEKNKDYPNSQHARNITMRHK